MIPRTCLEQRWQAYPAKGCLVNSSDIVFLLVSAETTEPGCCTKETTHKAGVQQVARFLVSFTVIVNLMGLGITMETNL